MGAPLPIFPPLEWQVHTCHTGVGFSKDNKHGGKAKLSNIVRIGKKNTEPHGGGVSYNKNNNGGGAYKRRLKNRKECELGRAAATFEILKKSRFPEGGKVGQVTLHSGARTTRLLTDSDGVK